MSSEFIPASHREEEWAGTEGI
jgi:hypothetical protein